MSKGEANYNWVDVPKYDTMHARVRRYRGSARQFLCETCGVRQATQWAYNHADDDAVTELSGKYAGATYSLKLENYDPLCRSCHALLDFSMTDKRNRSTLTAAQVREIKARLAVDTYRGILTELADEHGVNICTISAIRSGQNWRWLT